MPCQLPVLAQQNLEQGEDGKVYSGIEAALSKQVDRVLLLLLSQTLHPLALGLYEGPVMATAHADHLYLTITIVALQLVVQYQPNEAEQVVVLL